jgi:predicted DNA-binding transcriptional regulator AlpA
MSRSAIKTMSRRAAAVSAPPPEDRYINREQLRALIPASDMTLWRWQRNPKVAFPCPVKLGDDGRNYWWLPAIRSWMRQRQERSNQSPAGVRHDGEGAKCQRGISQATRCCRSGTGATLGSSSNSDECMDAAQGRSSPRADVIAPLQRVAELWPSSVSGDSA